MNDIVYPKHIAIIMDGNGRWAKKKGQPRTIGHYYGAKVLEDIIEYACAKEIRCMTFYAFSTENWNRPKNEVDTLMRLLEEQVDKLRSKYNNQYEKYKYVEFRFVGRLSILSESLQNKMRFFHERKPDIVKTTINLAINYGGKAEIIDAVNDFINEFPGRQITEEEINRRIYLKGLPEADLIIRTANEKRLSNFLTWESVYSELYFTPVLWPDFSEKDLDEAVTDFNNRKRTFGSV